MTTERAPAPRQRRAPRRRGSDPSEMTNKDIQQIGNRGAHGRLQEITATGEADDKKPVDPFSQAELNNYTLYLH